MLSQDRVRELTTRIVAIARPIYIYLFGSHATGTASDDSDVDILVVVPDSVRDPRAVSASIRLALSDTMDVPYDILVERESAFIERSQLPTIERTIRNTGIPLYAA